MEGAVVKKIQKSFKGTQTAGKNFLKPAINATLSVIGMALAAKSKNLPLGEATTEIIKSISGHKILSLTDMHENGLRMKVI